MNKLINNYRITQFKNLNNHGNLEYGTKIKFLTTGYGTSYMDIDEKKLAMIITILTS